MSRGTLCRPLARRVLRVQLALPVLMGQRVRRVLSVRQARLGLTATLVLMGQRVLLALRGLRERLEPWVLPALLVLLALRVWRVLLARLVPLGR